MEMFQITIISVGIAFFTLVGYSVWEMYDHKSYAKAWFEDAISIRIFIATMVISITLSMGSFLVGLWNVV